MMHKNLIFIKILPVFILLIFTQSNSYAQKNTYGEIPILGLEERVKLYSFLNNTEDLDWAKKSLKILYGSAFLEDLVRLVIHIPEEGKIKYSFVGPARKVTQSCEKNRRRGTNWVRLNGVKNIFVTLFISDSLRGYADPSMYIPMYKIPETICFDSTRMELLLHRASLDHQPDPFVIRFIQSFSSIINLGAPQAREETQTVDTKVTIEDLGVVPLEQDSSTHLFVGFGKLSITENSWTRLTVASTPDWAIRNNHALSFHFSNRPAHAYNFGVAVMFSKEWYAKPFVFFQRVLINRPSIPQRGPKIGICVGATALKKDFLDHVFLGLTFKPFVYWPTFFIGLSDLEIDKIVKMEIKGRSIFTFGFGIEI